MFGNFHDERLFKEGSVFNRDEQYNQSHNVYDEMIKKKEYIKDDETLRKVNTLCSDFYEDKLKQKLLRFYEWSAIYYIGEYNKIINTLYPRLYINPLKYKNM
jgi:hypothetical protein